jgi:hypothetical protein
MPTCYRLSLHPQLEEFRSELEFACHFIDRCHPTTRSGSDATIVVHYGPEPPADAIHIPNTLFPEGVIVNHDGIHPNFDKLSHLEKAGQIFPLLPSPPNNGKLYSSKFSYDALGLIFLMLSRLEERGNKASSEERYQRFPFKASIQARCGNIETPYADIAAKHVASTILNTSEPDFLNKYNVILTHDVDRLRGFDTVTSLAKITIGDVIFRKSIKLAIKRLRDAFTAGEPWKACRYVMRNAEKYGFSCRFYFMGPTDNCMDNSYSMRWPNKVKRLANEIISRGHVVGFHPGAQTSTNQIEWERQRNGLNDIVGLNVEEGRQHALIFEIDSTWDIWDLSGMKSDMTLGYPAPSGFRSGTCRSHPIYSLKQRRMLELQSYPTAIMDFGFFGGKYRDLAMDTVMDECQRIIDICKTWQGDLVVLFHPSMLTKVRRDFFERLLERL